MEQLFYGEGEELEPVPALHCSDPTCGFTTASRVTLKRHARVHAPPPADGAPRPSPFASAAIACAVAGCAFACSSASALQAMESKAVLPPTGAMVDQLDELLLVESWFRGRNGADALVADTVVGALEKLAAHVRATGISAELSLG